MTRKFYTYSSPLTLKQIEWLRNCPDPPARLRALIDTAMHACIANNVEAKRKKLAELQDMFRLLTDPKSDDKWGEKCSKRARAVMKEIKALEKELP